MWLLSWLAFGCCPRLFLLFVPCSTPASISLLSGIISCSSFSTWLAISVLFSVPVSFVALMSTGMGFAAIISSPPLSFLLFRNSFIMVSACVFVSSLPSSAIATRVAGSRVAVFLAFTIAIRPHMCRRLSTPPVSRFVSVIQPFVSLVMCIISC